MKLIHHKKPTAKEMIADIERLIKCKTDLDSQFNLLDQVFDVIGSDFYEACYITFDVATEAIADKLDISIEDLSWFIFDNDCGREGLEVPIKQSDGTIVDTPATDVNTFVKFLRQQ